MNFDNMINNILGKKKTVKGKSKSINKFGMKPLGMSAFKSNMGASIRMQSQWRNMTPKMKNINRMLFKDSDGDRVPNKWDCQPMNKFKQDIKFGPKKLYGYEHLDTNQWSKFKTVLNKKTKKDNFEMTPDDKIEKIFKFDKNLKLLEKEKNNNDEYSYYGKRNKYARIAMKNQNYNDEDVDEYLALLNEKKMESEYSEENNDEEIASKIRDMIDNGSVNASGGFSQNIDLNNIDVNLLKSIVIDMPDELITDSQGRVHMDNDAEKALEKYLMEMIQQNPNLLKKILTEKYYKVSKKEFYNAIVLDFIEKYGNKIKSVNGMFNTLEHNVINTLKKSSPDKIILHSYFSTIIEYENLIDEKIVKKAKFILNTYLGGTGMMSMA